MRWMATGGARLCGAVGMALLAGCAHTTLPQPMPPTAILPMAHSWGDPAVISTWNALGEVDAPPGQTLTATSVLAAALAFNPRVELARAQLDAGNAGVLTARQRLNPTLSLTPERVLGALAGASPWIAAVSLVWPVQTAGKRTLAIEQALATQDAGLLSAASSVWQLRSAARAAICNAEFAHAKALLAQQELALRAELVDRLDKQVVAGVATRYDAARSRLDRDGARLRAQQAQADLRGAQQDIATIAGLPAAAIDPFSPGDTCLEKVLTADSERIGEVAAAAVATRLDLRSRLAEFQAADAAWRTEIARRTPDLNLGPGYTFDQGVDKITFSLSGELPVFARNNAAIATAAAERRRLVAEISILQNDVHSAVDRARAQLRAAESQAATAREIAQQTGQLLQRDIARQTDGELDQATVTVTRIAAVVSQSEVLNARRALMDAVAAFETAAQAPVVAPFFDVRSAQALLTEPGKDSKEPLK